MTTRHCCGCLSSVWQSFNTGSRYRERTYHRAKYNEREYCIEFENLVEEEDFYAPPQHAVSEIERDLLARGKYGELYQHEKELNAHKEEVLRQKEEDIRAEEEAYITAKKEASKVSRQKFKKQPFDKSRLPDMKTFSNGAEFSQWLSEENIDITSPDFDIEDFDSFLEKVKAKSAQAIQASTNHPSNVLFEQTLSRGLEATKIAGDALNALQPVELHAVSAKDTINDLSISHNESNDKQAFFVDELVSTYETPVTTVAIVNTPRNVAPNLNPNTSVNTTSHVSNSDTSSFKMVNSNERQLHSFSDLNDDDNEEDDDDDFISANSNEGGFEELLT